MRVAVVGAGVVGLSIAVELAERGGSVHLIDAGRVGAGTSSTSFAWVNSHRKHPRPYHDLNVAGLRAHHAAAGPWFFPTGNLEVATTPAHAAHLDAERQRLRELDYPARPVTVREARQLEPALAIPETATAIVHYPTEGHCHTQVWMGHLRQRLLALGGRLYENAPVVGVDRGAAGVVVATAGEPPVTVDAVVFAVGRWTETVVRSLTGHVVPMSPTEGRDLPTLGFLGLTEPLPVDLRGIVISSPVSFRPEGNGRLMVQVLELDDAADSRCGAPARGGAIAAEFARRASTALAGHPPVHIATMLLGVRAIPADGHTVCGWVDEAIYTVATHSGVTLAPALAPLVAEELLGRPSDRLASFRPDRFDPVQTHTVAAPRSPGDQ